MLTATAEPTPEALGDIAERANSGWRSAVFPANGYVAFRIAFGVLVAISQLRFLARGWVEEFYLAPDHHLTYPAFEWVRPLPSVLMYGVVIGLAVLGVFMAAGLRPRLAAAMFVVGFSYCELIDAGLYLNHYWFITLAALLIAILPGPTGAVVPAVTVWALRAQLAAVYVFAGIAKLNTDWLLRAEPLHTWLAARTDRPIIGSLLDEPSVTFAFSWAGAAFDLTIVAWLLWKKTRPAAYAILVVFHFATAALFQIGMFPWMMIALTPIFFSPSWPTRFTPSVRASDRTACDDHQRPRPIHRATVATLAGLLVLNVALPLRHLGADGNVRWNDDGYLLSWRVMLTERATDVVFTAHDPATGRTTEVDPSTVLTEWQAASAFMRADLILTTAHLIADDQQSRTGHNVEVYADAVTAWNGRLRTQWIKPDVDLASLSRHAPASAYVVEEPTNE